MSRLVLAAAAVAFLVLPASALAQGYYGPFQPQTEDYGPGITVSGAGFAPLGHRDRATARAVGDARRRAEAIAMALGVSVSGARAIELSTPFDPRPDDWGFTGLQYVYEPSKSSELQYWCRMLP